MLYNMELDESRYSYFKDSFDEEDKSDSYDSSLTITDDRNTCMLGVNSLLIQTY